MSRPKLIHLLRVEDRSRLRVSMPYTMESNDDD